MTATYTALVERDDRFWYIRVPEIGRSTQARHLREVDAMARDLIALMEDVGPDSFELDVHIDPPEQVAKHLQRVQEFRDQEARAKRQAAEELRAAARELRADGVPMRDVGRVLGVSHQRVDQLLKAS